MDTKPLSEVQQKILDAIRSFVEDNDRPPTIREIQAGAGLSSTSLVKYHMDILMDRGYIRHRAGTARGVEVLADAEARRRSFVISVPIMGVIAAGQPIEAVRLPEEMYLSHDMARVGDYALRVRGTSMIEDHIEDGDIVIVREQDDAYDGDTVVALLLNNRGDVSGEATLKRFYREQPQAGAEKGRIRLEPRNAAMKPIFVDPEFLKIQGRVVGVIRLLA